MLTSSPEAPACSALGLPPCLPLNACPSAAGSPPLPSTAPSQLPVYTEGWGGNAGRLCVHATRRPPRGLVQRVTLRARTWEGRGVRRLTLVIANLLRPPGKPWSSHSAALCSALFQNVLSSATDSGERRPGWNLPARHWAAAESAGRPEGRAGRGPGRPELPAGPSGGCHGKE